MYSMSNAFILLHHTDKLQSTGNSCLLKGFNMTESNCNPIAHQIFIIHSPTPSFPRSSTQPSLPTNIIKDQGSQYVPLFPIAGLFLLPIMKWPYFTFRKILVYTFLYISIKKYFNNILSITMSVFEYAY